MDPNFYPNQSRSRKHALDGSPVEHSDSVYREQPAYFSQTSEAPASFPIYYAQYPIPTVAGYSHGHTEASYQTSIEPSKTEKQESIEHVDHTFVDASQSPRSSVRHSRGSSILYQNSLGSAFTNSTRSSVVSRKSVSDKLNALVCTLCEQDFARDWDWKHHEETFHERWSVWICADCNQYFWDRSQFNQHHKVGHNCHKCKHADDAIRQRKKRSAWGCGFCRGVHYDWDERCKHVIEHYKLGKKKSEWSQTNVIYGLLRQENIHSKFQHYFLDRHGAQTRVLFSWNKKKTGRSNDLDLIKSPPQLQDLLEFDLGARSDLDLAYIVGKAYKEGFAGVDASPKGHPMSKIIDDSAGMAWIQPDVQSPVQEAPVPSVITSPFYSGQRTAPQRQTFSQMIPANHISSHMRERSESSEHTRTTYFTPDLNRELPPVPLQQSESISEAMPDLIPDAIAGAISNTIPIGTMPSAGSSFFNWDNGSNWSTLADTMPEDTYFPVQGHAETGQQPIRLALNTLP